jgi:hypothetical protein
MSIFHPFVYPAYRSPILEGSEKDEEDEDYYSSNKRDTTKKNWFNQTPDEQKGDNLEVPKFEELPATEKKKTAS